MKKIFLPSCQTFQNNNSFFGSFLDLRFKLMPLNDMEEVRAEFWYGNLCYELSQIVGEKIFPLSDDGIFEMGQWLTELAEHPAESNMSY